LRDVARPGQEADWTDRFPEDALRLAVLRDKEPVVAWLDYHRSRVWLTRALAVFLPAATFAAVLGAAARLTPAAEPGRGWVALVPVIYAVVAWPGWRRRERSGNLAERRPTWPLAPRTNRPQAYDYGEDQGFAADDDTSRHRRWHSLVRVALADPAVQGAALLHVAAIVAALMTGRGAIVGLALVGAGVSAMSGCSWWRIGATYRHYLRQAGRLPPEHPSR
jgi:hypothetical protein